MSLERMLQQALTSDEVEITAGWAQGRALYGGLTAALLGCHLQQRTENTLPLRTLSIAFVGPIALGTVSLHTEILRRGKSVLQAETRLLQNGETLAVALASFGAARHSQLQQEGEAAPPYANAEDCLRMPYLPGVVPEFLQHLQLAFAIGRPPFSGAGEGVHGGWMQLHSPHDAGGLAEVLLLGDAWPPTVLQMLQQPAPASSLTWTLDFVVDPRTVQPAQAWRYLASTDACADGYAQTQAKLWDGAGRLVAISRQTVTVFA